MYRWNTPLDWLIEQAQEWDSVRLYQELMHVARRLDSDSLQDEYQTEMDKAGYFTQVREV